ncbi:MAG: putative phage abortive infection protein [Sulfuricaulis sp.]|uniref:putative phage abortive infection protein n=1 Tax=Sulfuricaulis sp. TaxID=2003553 RepID=UPI0025E5CA8B|nr:putative phage abortive infection protein [Sulfuricaulis sp.]MCR4348057.1 putative phage abortive infection protein [Sulfuricaulis sp.]
MASDQNTPKTGIKTLGFLMLIVLVVWTLGGILLYGRADRGTFGDMFGAVNALFAGLAFAGIIYTIFLQRTELELQRRELTETRKELEGQKLQLERQAFENAFFQMLTLHNEIVGSFSYSSVLGVRVFQGKECFSGIKNDFLVAYLKNPTKGGPIEERYKTYYLTHAHEVLGHYFRNLYQIVKYINDSTVQNKKFYTNIIRAQLSSAELFLLFFNSLSEFGYEKFHPLILKFELLEHLPQDGDIQSADATRFGSKAFGTSPQWATYLGAK